jgi:hypothetical protein
VQVPSCTRLHPLPDTQHAPITTHVTSWQAVASVKPLHDDEEVWNTSEQLPLI